MSTFRGTSSRYRCRLVRLGKRSCDETESLSIDTVYHVIFTRSTRKLQHFHLELNLAETMYQILVFYILRLQSLDSTQLLDEAAKARRRVLQVL